MRKSFRILLVLLAAVVLWGLFENRNLQINSLAVSSGALPEAFDGFRIAQVSDLHNARFGPDNGELLELLQMLQPDVIAITGDLIDSGHTDRAAALQFVQKAAQIAPCFFVSGNHEAWTGGYETFSEDLEKAGVTVLKNRGLRLEREGQSIALMGIEDPTFLGKQGFLRTLEQLTGEEYTVLLSHRPEYFPQYCQCGFDLVLSGHAHGGQFRLPLVGGVYAPGQGLFPEYDGGLYFSGDTAMAVSRGLGNSVIPIRLNNPPEILLITLYCQNR